MPDENGVFNLTGEYAIQQGSLFSFSFVFLDDNEDPVNLTNAVVSAKIKQRWDLNVVATFDAQVYGDPLSGTVVLSLDTTSACYKPVKPGMYLYDVFVTLSGLPPQKLFGGDCEISPSISNP